MKRIFKYYPQDFGELTVKVEHMGLDFDIYEDHTIVESKLKVRTLEDIDELELDAKNLDVLDVKCDIDKISYEYKKDNDKLLIKFSKKIQKDTYLIISTKTKCEPTKHILEGLYYDETPKNCPMQQVTQCQQWGFQRIVPCIDDMTAKCTYKTSITADSRYTNMLTNGDVSIKRHSVGDKRDKISYDNIITPMATYLFFLGVGTYATFTKEFIYPDGKKFTLELLGPPNSDKEIANRALEVLYDSIMWIYLFTGPDSCNKLDVRHEILELIKERDILIKQNKNYSNIKTKLEDLLKKITPGYQYTGTVYREIGMQNSNFGGMENVGNTTISTNRLMPYKEMTDGAFEYMIRVKVHEFYHNLNGSEVTGKSPFQIWLNEAVTVHIERAYHAFLFGNDYHRLQSVLGLIGPSGTFDQDAGASSMPIEPDGFNNPDELITGITYVKAPEVVRMVQTLLGPKKFVEALHDYHAKYKHGNASTDQWIECMEKGVELKDMLSTWLKEVNYPVVRANVEFDKQNMNVVAKFKQISNKKWEFPMTVALVNKDGNDINQITKRITKDDNEIIFENVEEYTYVSMNRGQTFYGRLVYEQSDEDLFLQVKTDKDIIARYMAFYKLFDSEKLRLLEKKDSKVDQKLVELYFELLNNEELMDKAGSQFLAIFESVESDLYKHHYSKLYDVKKKISTTIVTKYESELFNLYEKYNRQKSDGTYSENQVYNIKQRQLKNLCLGLLSKLDTPKIHTLIKKQFNDATNATDKNIAFLMYINSSASDKNKLINEFEKIASKNPVSWEVFLVMIANNDSDDAIEIMQRIENSKQFRIEQFNDQKSLLIQFAYNKKKSLETNKGREYLKNILIKLAKYNEYACTRTFPVFGFVDMMEDQYKVPVVKLLVDVLDEINQKDHPSVFNTIKRILSKTPNSVKMYEKEYGKINLN